jgi:hypothetical protein
LLSVRSASTRPTPAPRREHLGAPRVVGLHVLGVRLVEQHEPARAGHHALHRRARERRGVGLFGEQR